jgi:hypothetical protein
MIFHIELEDRGAFASACSSDDLLRVACSGAVSENAVLGSICGMNSI